MPVNNQRADHMQRLIKTLSSIVESQLDLATFMHKMVLLVQDLMMAQGVVLELVEYDQMVYRSGCGCMSPHVGYTIRREGTLSGLCLRTRTTLNCADTENDSRVAKEACRELNIRSMLCTPLLQSGVPIGVIKVVCDTVNGFDEQDVQTLDMLSGVLGAALSKQLTFESLQQAESKMRHLLENASHAVITTDQTGFILRWNQAAERLLGWTAAEVIGSNLANSSGNFPRLEHIFAPCYASTALSWKDQCKDSELITRYNQTIAVEVNLSINQFDQSGSEFTAFIHDISERKRMEQSMLNLALSDGLTGLANRRKIMDAINHAVARMRRQPAGMALLFMDLNDFKKINDEFGHDIGDMALQELAQRLLLCVRETDVVGRLGGDEFVILGEGIENQEQAQVLVNRIMVAMEQPMKETGLPLAVSIGVSLYKTAWSADEWLNSADAAMYSAKQQQDGAYRLAFYTEGEQVARRA